MTTPTKTVAAPKVHPLVIGSLYGLVAAIINVVGVALNHNVSNSPNGLIGFAVTVLIPIIGLYLSGHYAGRHQRLNFPESSMTGGFRSVLSGLGSGFANGLVYIIASLILANIPALKINQSGLTDVVRFLENIGGLILYPLFGLILGTIGGIFGDSRAHTQLKNGAVVAK